MPYRHLQESLTNFTHIAATEASVEVLAEFVKDRSDEVPKDARLVDLFLDPWTKSFVFVWEHESFEVRREGDTIKRVNILRSRAA